MVRSRALFLAFLATAGVGGFAAIVSCLDDPRADDKVTVINTCDVTSLSADAAAPGSTLKQYVTASNMLLQQATAVEQELTAACNAIDTELQLATGTNSTNACAPINARIQGLLKAQPPAPPGAQKNVPWVQITFPPSCQIPPGTLEQCVEKCTASCDVSKCDPTKVAGKCTGDCTGTCTTTGDNQACQGTCVGTAVLDGGSCVDECNGHCNANAWAGDCSATCPGAFTGLCRGTCTGTCDGVPINVQPTPDAGADGGADAGEDGGMDAGAPTDAGGGGGPKGPSYPHPPANADGNCAGKCVGQCSSGPDGTCQTPCLTFADGGPPYGNFQGGFCGSGDAPGLCTGNCIAADGVGTTLTCSGSCTQYKTQCDGICRPGSGADAGACSVPLQNAYCEGALGCKQNVECNNACEAFAQLSATCGQPEIVSVFAVSDPALYAAIKKFGGQLGQAVNHLASVRTAFSFIGNRAYGDFVNIGLTGDETLACATLGTQNATKAQTLIQAASSADPTIAKY